MAIFLGLTVSNQWGDSGSIQNREWYLQIGGWIIDICAIVVIREFRSLHMLTAMVNILHI